MQRYETIFIVDPDLNEEGRAPLLERVKELIPQQGGWVVAQEEWGNKRLAYAIRKKIRGYYVRADYCGSGPLVDELERFFRIDDRVLKYMTVLLEKQVDVDRLKAEKVEAEAQSAAAAQKAAAEAEQQASGTDAPQEAPASDPPPQAENNKE